MLGTNASEDAGRAYKHQINSSWSERRKQFLAAVPRPYRRRVAALLNQVHQGGSGLRDWVDGITWRRAHLPATIPAAVIDVYLADPEAIPLYDCEGCGIAIPVRPNRLYGIDGEPEQVYFTVCPACGSRTGLFLHFSRLFEEDRLDSIRRKPR